MQTVDEKPETIHLYVVREKEPTPSVLPIVLSALALAVLFTFCALIPYQQLVMRAVIRVPDVLLPMRTFRAAVAVVPTGVKVNPATTARGVLTITNGSVIAQILPAGFTTVSNNGISVVTDRAVFVPAGNANGYGYATVAAHALIYGKKGNLLTYAIDYVEGAAIYIRNLTPFTGGRDSYSVRYATPQNKQTALITARNLLATEAIGLRYPCSENSLRTSLIWHCQFLTYSLPLYMHVSAIKIIGKNLLINIWFVARPIRVWVK